ncbi:MAG TPA: sugar ABC transporter permease [Anaerolineales bacterium]|nr:sugar ABC transporter permease [Anaerolineales bacterium]
MAVTGAEKKRFQLPSPLVLREWLEGYIFAGPFIIGFLVFTAFPMIFSIWMSLNSWDLISPPRFVGLENIIKSFTDERTLLSLYNSAYYTIFAVPIQLVISFSLALALTQKIKFRDVYRSGFYLPIIVPLVAWSVVWQRVLHPEFGILNEILGWFGVAPRAWLFDPDLAKPAFIFMSFWFIGRQMVIFIAGLGNIPESLLEAASIDGAGPLHRLRHITIPLMTPLIFYNMVIAIINSFQSFIPAKVMTNGGPENATLFSVLHIYRQGFEFYNMGFASALAWQLFIIVVGFTIAQFWISNRWVYYES